MPVFVPDRKRNLRGERRVASLLDAAGHVFGELGYHAANTNAIAAEATETRKFCLIASYVLGVATLPVWILVVNRL